MNSLAVALNTLSLLCILYMAIDIVRCRSAYVDKRVAVWTLASFLVVNASLLILAATGGDELSVRLFYVGSISLIAALNTLLIVSRSRLIAFALSAAGFALAVDILFFDNLVQGIIYLDNGFASRNPGPLYPAYLLWAVFSTCSQIFFGVRAWRDIRRPVLCNRTRLILLALIPTHIVIAVLAVQMFEPKPAFNAVSTMPFAIIGFVAVLYYAAITRSLPVISLVNDTLVVSQRRLVALLKQTRAITTDPNIPLRVKRQSLAALWAQWPRTEVAFVDGELIDVPAFHELAVSSEAVDLIASCFPMPVIIEFGGSAGAVASPTAPKEG